MSGRPPAKLELVSTGEGKKEKKRFGAIWRSQFPGVYNARLALPHPTDTNAAGYPEDDDIVAVKTRSGAKYVVDPKKGFFINLNAYEAMEERPPYDGPGAGSKKEETNSEDFSDDDF